jgi:hypothetical protein
VGGVAGRDAAVAEAAGSDGATEADGAGPTGPGVGAAADEAPGLGSGGAALAAALSKENPAAIATATVLVDKFIMPLWVNYLVVSNTAASLRIRKRVRSPELRPR